MTMRAEFRAASRRTVTIAIAVFCSGAFAARVAPDRAPGAKGDTTADGILGQLDFVHNIRNFVDGRGINSSQDSVGDVAIDKSPAGPAPDRVFIVDRANHRVLGWKNISAFATKAPADLVIGQPDFNSNIANNGGLNAASLNNPTGVAVDSKGNLYIADYSNHRVLYYQAPFGKGKNAGIAADDVFGQFGSFATQNCNDFGISAGTLCGPVRIAVDAAENVYIADQINHRVLEFNTPQKISAVPGSGDTTADRVFGQLDAFNTGSCNLATNPSTPSAKTLCNPSGLTTFQRAGVATSDLYVADYSNNRVLVYTTPLGNGTTADKVYGQLDFTQNTANSGGLNQKSLNGPASVAVDSTGAVLVADYGNHRALLFPATGAVGAIRVFGQFGSMFSQLCDNTGGGSFLAGGNPKNLCAPNGIAADGTDGIYIADSRNNRVLQFKPPFPGTPAAVGVLGQQLTNPGANGGTSSNTSIANGLDGRGFAMSDFSEGAVAIDRSANPNRIYVSDPPNHRVLGWSDINAFTTHAPATVVIGQPNAFTGGDNGFGASGCNNGGLTAKSLCHPRGVAVDASGNLYVADQQNHRVLIYKKPVASGANAFRVLGQSGSFTTNGCNQGGLSANSLCTPIGIGVDTAGNVYVGDFSNNRVLAYNKPLTTGATADKVFGQGGVFNSSSCNLGGVPSASSLCSPSGVTVDTAGNVYVADFTNNRALEYNAPLAAGGNTVADKVFGQNNSFASGTCNLGGPLNGDTLCGPRWIATDKTGHVYIADTGNQRVLAYIKPLTTNRTADRVFGQGNLLTTSGCKASGPNASGLSPNTLSCAPEGLGIDSGGNLYITDTGNNRVLQYLTPFTP